MRWTPVLMDSAVPVALVTVGLLAGLVAERGVLPRLQRYAVGRRWAGGDLLIAAFRGVTFTFFLIAGVYAAFLAMPLPPANLTILHKGFLVALVPLATIVLARITGSLVSTYSRGLYRGKDVAALPSPSILANLTKLLVFIIGGLIILQSLGIAISPILTALGVGGLAVALALQETLSNLFSGIYIMVSRQIRPGDYIKLNTGEEGHVVDINWRSTQIREAPNNMIIVPNAKLGAANVTNYHQPDAEVLVTIPVTVSYESDLDRVEQVTLEVARDVMRETPGGIPEFEPRLRYHTFGEASVNFNVFLRAREIIDQPRIKHAFVKRLHNRYGRERITFRSCPEIYLRNGNGAADPMRREVRSSPDVRE
jgi:small-conductance mechanosensitive channel